MMSDKGPSDESSGNDECFDNVTDQKRKHRRQKN